MSEGIEAIRQTLMPVLATQEKHPVRPMVEVLWNRPMTITEVPIRLGEQITTVAVDGVQRLVAARAALLRNEREDMLRFMCEPDEYRIVDLECAKKRRANPGVQLLLWLSGGIRSSKTFGLSRRLSCVQWHTQDAWCWAVHETDVTSGTIQQPDIYNFVPREIREAGSKQTVNAKKGMAASASTYFAYSPGRGFTGSQFYMKWDAHDWRGCASPGQCDDNKRCAHWIKAGGRMEFRFYKQDESTMVGQKLTCAMCDEKTPPNIVKLIEDRLLQRAQDTAQPAYLERLDAIIAKLEAGQRADTTELACIYLGWQLISFTPKWGWTPTVNLIAQGAVEYEHYDPRPMVRVAMQNRIDSEPDEAKRLQLAHELQLNPWNLGNIESVPRFAQPQNPRWLIAYLPTWANAFGGNWTGLVQQMQGRSDEEKLITMFGVVRNKQHALFQIDEKRHVRREKELPIDANVIIVCDPAPGKPWVVKTYLIDPLKRYWCAQEWPCPSREIRGHGKPGHWAVPSEKNRRNGDAGEVQKLRLGWGWDEWHHLIWSECQRMATRLRAVHGAACRVPMMKTTFEWAGKPHLKLEGEFVVLERCMMDSAFASAPTSTKGGSTTIIDALSIMDHAPDWTPTPRAHLQEGYTLLDGIFNEDVCGMPGLMCLDECENTLFAWRTFCIPEFKDDTHATDEACKDFIDPDRYLVSTDPEYSDVQTRAPVRGGSFGKRN